MPEEEGAGEAGLGGGDWRMVGHGVLHAQSREHSDDELEAKSKLEEVAELMEDEGLIGGRILFCRSELPEEAGKCGIRTFSSS